MVIDYGEEIGIHHNPVTIAQYAIGCYHNYVRYRCEPCLEVFANQIKYLKTRYQRYGEDLIGYPYGFDWSYGLKRGWLSGLAQGQAISVLIRHYHHTGDESVLPLMVQIKNLMLLPRAEGGLVVQSPEGDLWIEEFPTERPSLVLNGFISAVFGLYEYTRVFPEDGVARTKLDEFISSLKSAIRHYDAGNWAYLDRHVTPYPKASEAYMFGYIWQMRTLYEISGDPYFRAMELRWQSFFYDVNFKRSGNMVQEVQGYYYVPAKPLVSTPPASIIISREC